MAVSELYQRSKSFLLSVGACCAVAIAPTVVAGGVRGVLVMHGRSHMTIDFRIPRGLVLWLLVALAICREGAPFLLLIETPIF